MKTNYKNILYAAASIVIIILSLILIHDYVFYVSHLEKIEFEEIIEKCDLDCKIDLEDKGYECNFKEKIGYVCIPLIDKQNIQRKSFWGNVDPPSYGYAEAMFEDDKYHIGFLKEIHVIDKNTIDATFTTSDVTKHIKAKIPPDLNFEQTKTLAVGDTFIPRCNNEFIFVYKLHDIQIVDGVSFAVFVYRIGTSDILQCEFPEFLEQSFRVKFDV